MSQKNNDGFITAPRSYASAVLGAASKEPTGDIFTPHERAILLVVCHPTRLVGDDPFQL